jgi:hypothetical protein
MTNEQLNEIWKEIVENMWATDEQLAIVTGINGYTMEVMDSVLWHLHGLDFEQMKEELYP